MNIRTIAEKAGLSKSAVSLALRNDPSIPLATRNRVKKLAEALGYKPNPKLSAIFSAIAHKTQNTITAPIAVLSCWPQPKMWSEPDSHLDRFYHGCLSRAAELGYTLEEFWLSAPRMTTKRMVQILRTRGIEGVLVFNYPNAPAQLEIDLGGFASAVIGRALIRPRLFAVEYDHYQGMFLALDEITRRGYRRPALVLTRDGHERTMYSWAGAYLWWLNKITPGAGIPVLIFEDVSQAALKKWFHKYRPDVLLVNDERTLAYCRETLGALLDDVGVVTLFWRNESHGLAGIDARDEIIGARAIDIIAEGIRHNRLGLPTTPETVLIDGLWRDGPSLPNRA